MRVSILVSSIIVSLLFIIAIGKNSVAASQNCEDLIFDHEGCDVSCDYDEVVKSTYKCKNKKDFADDVGDWELEFYVAHAAGAPMTDPDRLLAGFESGNTDIGVLGCQCLATGSFTNPKFDTDNVFHCTGPNANEEPNRIYSLQGHLPANATDPRIQQGQAVNDIGRSWVFECEFDECICESPND